MNQPRFRSRFLIRSANCIGLFLLSFSFALAEDFVESGFLDDYSKLVPSSWSEGEFLFEAPNAPKRVNKYDSLMLDQPEIILASDSKKGLKPDDAKLIADTLRMAMVKALERGHFRLVTTPGPNTLYFRVGMTNVYLKKRRKRLIQFTPVGLVATVASAPFRDVMNKLQLTEATFEAELLDSETAETLGMIVVPSGDRTEKKEFTSWDELNAVFESRGARLACRLNNSRLPGEERKDCGAVGSDT